MAEALRRRAGRVVMVGPDQAVLLMSGRDPAADGSETFWFVPGGGADPGESVEDAARREVYEEVGARLGALGPVVWEREVSFWFAGTRYEQAECFYVARTERFVPHAAGLTPLEVRFTTGARWWDLDDLARFPGQVYPRQLVALVKQWLDCGPPALPLRID